MNTLLKKSKTVVIFMVLSILSFLLIPEKGLIEVVYALSKFIEEDRNNEVESILLKNSNIFSNIEVKENYLPSILEDNEEKIFNENEQSENKEIDIEKITYYQVSADYLNIRAKPTHKSREIGVFTKDSIIQTKYETDNGWLKLSRTGFVNKKYVKSINQEKAIELYKNQKEKAVEVIQPIKAENKNNSKHVNPNSFTEYEIDLLARLVRAEAESEPYEGKVAVALVVLNRLVSDDFPNTIRDVIYSGNGKQFNPVANGSINKPATDESRKAAEEAIETHNYRNDGTLYFYNPKTATNRWLDTLTTSKVIGNHTFKYAY